MDKKGLNKFVTRYAVRHEFKNAKGDTEVAILLTTKKTYVSSKDNFKFYAKVACLLDLQDLTTEKVKNLLPKLDLFGQYLVLTTYRATDGPNTYAIVCPQMKGTPFKQMVSPLMSFIPRIDGKNGKVICGLRIGSVGEKVHSRQWTRYIGSNRSNSNGFHELPLGHNYDNDLNSKSSNRFIGFYVTINTSLIVYDLGTTDPKKVLTPDQNYTLIQEGGFVYGDADIRFRLCDQNDDKLLTSKELYEMFKDKTNPSLLGTDKYKVQHLIRDNTELKKKSVIIFLKTSSSLLPYGLFVTEDVSKDSQFKGKRILVLCLPTGAQFEYAEYWSLPDGLKSVINRQNKKPWSKYLQTTSDPTNNFFEDKIQDIFGANSYPIDSKEQKTPQNDLLYKMLKKGRKSGPSQPKDDTKTASKESKAEDISKDKTTDSPKDEPKPAETDTKTGSSDQKNETKDDKSGDNQTAGADTPPKE